VPVLASITASLTDAITSHGVWAVLLLMALDALLPVGGELVMVVAGAIAAGALAGHPQLLGHTLAGGAETYVVLALAGTVGYLLGSLVGYWVGRVAGREAVDRWGHRVHLGPHNLERAERWFDRHGPRAVFLGRLTPLVRSFVSIPSGLFGEPIVRYTLLTGAGSAIWCFGFAGLGWGLGSGYKSVDHVTHVVEALIVVVAVAGVGALAWRRRRSGLRFGGRPSAAARSPRSTSPRRRSRRS
jgi:membrane protein DedA with SNARE-associated domain